MWRDNVVGGGEGWGDTERKSGGEINYFLFRVLIFVKE